MDIQLRILLESERHKSVLLLAEEFENKCNTYLKSKKWYKHWESWLWNARGTLDRGIVHIDPILPDKVCNTANEALQRKLCNAGASNAEGIRICHELERASVQQILILKSLSKKDYAKLKDKRLSCDVEEGKVKLSFNGVCVEITQSHFEKLQNMYTYHNGSTHEYEENLFILLARYRSGNTFLILIRYIDS